MEGRKEGRSKKGRKKTEKDRELWKGAHAHTHTHTHTQRCKAGHERGHWTSGSNARKLSLSLCEQRSILNNSTFTKSGRKTGSKVVYQCIATVSST